MSMDQVAEQNYHAFMRAMEKAAVIIERQAIKEIEKLEHKLSQQAQDKQITKKIDTLEKLNKDIKNQVSYLEQHYNLANFGDRAENIDITKKDLEPFKKESPTIDYAIKNKATLECMTDNLREELRKPNPSLADLRKENKIFIHARANLKDKVIYKEPIQKKATQMSFDAACKNAIAKAAKAALEAPAKQVQQQAKNQDMELTRI